jgi:hypothetical protein
MRNSSTTTILKKRKKTTQSKVCHTHQSRVRSVSLQTGTWMRKTHHLEDGQEIEMDTQSTQQALVEQKQKEFDILSARLEENGWKLRLKVFADPLQSHRAISMTAPTSTLAEILQLVPLEDAEQISEFEGTVYSIFPFYSTLKIST